GSRFAQVSGAGARGARQDPAVAAEVSEPHARARNLVDAGTVDHRERPHHTDPENQARADRATFRARDSRALRRASSPSVKAAARAAQICFSAAIARAVDEDADVAANPILLVDHAKANPGVLTIQVGEDGCERGAARLGLASLGV